MTRDAQLLVPGRGRVDGGRGPGARVRLTFILTVVADAGALGRGAALAAILDDGHARAPKPKR